MDGVLESSFEQEKKKNDDIQFLTDLNTSSPLNTNILSDTYNTADNDAGQIFFAPESTHLLYSTIDDGIKEESVTLNLEKENFDHDELEKAINLGVVLNDEKENEAVNEESSLGGASQDESNSVIDTEWKEKDKHIFILSEAGKPIYTL